MALTPEAKPALDIGMVADPLSWALWPQAKAFLDPALMRSDEDWPEVERDLAKNDLQLWAVLDGPALIAAAVTRVALCRAGELAEIYLVGGRGFRRWIKPLNDTIANSAREIGCVAMRSYGRVGWRDILGALGWRVRAIAYERAL